MASQATGDSRRSSSKIDLRKRPNETAVTIHQDITAETNIDAGPTTYQEPENLVKIDIQDHVNFQISIPDPLAKMKLPQLDSLSVEKHQLSVRNSFSQMILQPRVRIDHRQTRTSKAKKSGTDIFFENWHNKLVAEVEAALGRTPAGEQDPGDEFWRKVVDRTNELELTQLGAIIEVYIDTIVEKAGSENQALLWILNYSDSNEICMELFVIRLLERKACVDTAFNDMNTPLHLTAKRGFTSIGKLLLEAGAPLYSNNTEKKTPLEICIQGKHNEFSALLIRSMEPKRVRDMFLPSNNRLSLHNILDAGKDMNDTVIAVLDTMVETVLSVNKQTHRVYYSVLDTDKKGVRPDEPKCGKTCLHKIAESCNKDVVYHDVVRLLIRRKWKTSMRYIFMLQCVYYLITMAALTCAFTLAARKSSDPRIYDTPVDGLRALCEVLAIIMLLYNLISEINQLRIHKLLYFKDLYNYLDAPAAILLFVIIPFRLTGLNVQWVFASLCYFFNGLRALKFAAVFRSTGAYVQILFYILFRDVLQFGVIFLMFLFTFSGAFYFALRGEEIGSTMISNATDNNLTDLESDSVLTSLDLYPYETGEIYHVWLTGLRVMIEGGKIVEYFGPNGFMWLGVIFYLAFLFLVIVVLLNLLIAQMSDTYVSVQQDAQRALVVNRAKIVARIEHNSWLSKIRIKLLDQIEQKWNPTLTSCLNKLFGEGFNESEDIIPGDPKDLLEKWEVQPINEVHRKLERLERSINRQEEILDNFRNSVDYRLNKLVEFIEAQQLTQST